MSTMKHSGTWLKLHKTVERHNVMDFMYEYLLICNGFNIIPSEDIVELLGDKVSDDDKHRIMIMESTRIQNILKKE